MTGRLASAYRLIRAFRHDTAAVAAAEFALVVPVFLLLVFGTINTCLMLAAVNDIHYAAERTARCQAVNVTGACPNADTYAKGIYRGPAVTGLLFTATPGQACGLRVVGRGTYTLITGFDATAVSISAQACYPVPPAVT